MPAKKNKAQEIVEDISAAAFQATGGRIGKRKKREMTPAKIADNNRKSGLEILAILKSINVKHGTYLGERQGDISPELLQQKIRDAISCLETANTIQDDVSGIDAVLKYAALALESGVRDNKPDKVKWGKNAICAGAIYWRFDVPEDHAADREANLAARTKYMGYYKSIIENAEIVDDKNDSANGLTRDLQDAIENYKQLRKEILAMGETAEGQALLGEIERNVSTPNNLSREGRAYQKKLKAAAIEMHAMKTLQGELEKVNAEMYAAQQRMRDYRTRLKDKPTSYNPEIMADYAGMLDDMVSDIARALAEAAETERLARDFEARLDAVLNGQDAQMLAKTLKDTQAELFTEEKDKDIDNITAGAKIVEKYKNQQAAKAAAKAKVEEHMAQLAAEAAAEAEKAAAEQAAAEQALQESMSFDEDVNENPNLNTVG